MDVFHTTQWSLVLRTRGPQAAAAWGTLCVTYRSPVLAFLRKRGYSFEDAEDLTQSFFTDLIQYNRLVLADPERGRLRCFLLTALCRFTGHRRAEQYARRRGGAELHVPLEDCEDQLTTTEGDSPEQAFDRAWSVSVLDQALGRLQQETATQGKAQLYEALSEFLIEAPDADEYHAIAVRFGMRSNKTVAVAVHRLRRRLHAHIRTVLAETLEDEGEVDSELTALSTAWVERPMDKAGSTCEARH